jgi:hypothetical protein
MIKFTAKPTPGRTLVGLGLSRKNWENLLEGKPIVISCEALHLAVAIDILIVGGETETSICQDLEDHGFNLPEDPDKIHIDPKVGG